MKNCGERLFQGIFDGSRAAIQLWTQVEPHLSSTRIEVTTGIAEATAIPWELIRDPTTGTNLALSVQAFVRAQRGARPTLAPQQDQAEKVRILLVICRPKGGEDVPFRSVAGRLATRLSDAAREAFDLDVLRPPTYEQLATTLRIAKEASRPYHIVHFDGHGVYADPAALASAGKLLTSLKMDGGATGAHGFLMFEDPDSKTGSEFVDGFKLGTLLRDSAVPLLVLNACQSAFAEAAAEPNQAAAQDAREEIRAYGSLAQAVVEAGAAGVVAMRYSVYVVTAAQFVAELYGALARGRALGEAVTWARKNLADRPERRITFEARPLQDWSVPVVWERSPLRLWPEKTDAPLIEISLDESAASKPGALDHALPARPDVGFYGRDGTLYALDRAFDTHKVALLHGYAGSGKTATTAEFARWYALTGGVEGPVLFNSFERHLPLARVLDKVGQVFHHALAASGVEWDAITDTAQRRNIALQVLQQVPVLWIWDNIEPITGFPAGSVSEWSNEEQRELREFLSTARDTKAKFLLTSRRDEQTWLGDLPRRVHVPPMPMQERLQLAGAIVEHRGKRLVDLPDLRPLLRFTNGNPLTILVTVGEALRTGIDTPERLVSFVESLQSGEAAFEDEEIEGRSKSLGASLSYGFGHTFDEDERKILALLHLFQGFVNVDALCAMVNTKRGWCLEAVSGLTRERGIALLDRAAEVGLLAAEGGGYYTIHPALPWYFRDLFEREFPETSGTAERARRDFVRVISAFSSRYAEEYYKGNRGFLLNLAAEEDNLLSAWRLGRDQGREALHYAMEGLRALYQDTGRRAAWRRLVEAVVPDFVDPETDAPLPGREEGWRVVTEWRVDLLQEERRWAEAERLLYLKIDSIREAAQTAMAVAPRKRNAEQANLILAFGASLRRLARGQLVQRHPACVDNYCEALKVYESASDFPAEASISLDIGTAFLTIAELRDPREAERWYKRSFNAADDNLARGKCLNQLGATALVRVEEALKAGDGSAGPIQHLMDAMRYYEDALDLLPDTAVTDRTVAHGNLGIVLRHVGEFDRALYHHQQAIRYSEQEGDRYNSGLWRFNAASTLLVAGRASDARAYAEAALSDFSTFGDRAADMTGETENLIARIDQTAGQGQGS
jgi:tetratricopeptide (TPR) repeat protein